MLAFIFATGKSLWVVCSIGPYSPPANPPDSISFTVENLLYIPLSPNLIYANLAVQYNLQYLSVQIRARHLPSQM
jgi:hypothetical protein